MSSLTNIPTTLAASFATYLLQTHPNTFALTPTSDIPPNLHYTSVLRAYLTENGASNSSDLPPHVAQLIDSVRRIQLPRTLLEICHVDIEGVQRRYPRLSQGMSPKKAHEVFRMAAYVLALVQANGLPTSAPVRGSQRLHIVDVGAGQGYLTRALCAVLPHARILALDADQAQIAGAVKWEERLFGKEDETCDKGKRKAGIQHRTVLIGAEGDTEELGLRKVINEWVLEGQIESPENEPSDQEQAPVLFVALHACGSLTPALLRAFVAASKGAERDANTVWRPSAAVAVGCCYNLMNSTDFPLSTTLRTHEPALDLPPAAFHLAAQIPGTWLVPRTSVDHETDTWDDCDDEELQVAPAVALAIRKVAWRALLEHALKTSRPMTDEGLRQAENRDKSATNSEPLIEESKEDESCYQEELESKIKKATKQNKKAKKVAKEKKPSATVPARWQRRPENWVVNADDELHESLPASATSSSSQQTTATEVQGQVQPQDHSAASSGIGATPALRRLGRLHDSAYTSSWDNFLQEAGARMGVVFEGTAEDKHAERTVLERQLETLHVLRCIVGPAIESAILKDRQEWVREALVSCAHQGQSKTEVGVQPEPLEVELVNLFDQATGSGRNVAIVISPRMPLTHSYST